jgi:hypothetical protein
MVAFRTESTKKVAEQLLVQPLSRSVLQDCLFVGKTQDLQENVPFLQSNCAFFS